MGLPKRCRRFLFEPQAFLNDPAVLQMTPTQLGAYAALLFSLWDMEEPGVVKDDDRVLSILSRTNGEWKDCREAVARAFDMKTRPGFWIQKRLAAVHKTQNIYSQEQAKRGRRGGKAKARKTISALASAKRLLSAPTDTATKLRVPTEEEVTSYCLERKNGINAAHFLAVNQANGWRRGKYGIRIRDWKAVIRTWEFREKTEPQQLIITETQEQKRLRLLAKATAEAKEAQKWTKS